MTERSNTIRLASDLRLPIDVATQSLAILAIKGAGKSNVAVVMAEAMYDLGVPWVAIDPKGDWHGIRQSTVPTKPGLPIPVFGGLHGDLPLEPGSGLLWADLVVEHNLTCVFDVSEFDTKQQMVTFLRDFGQRLFRLHAHTRTVRHLFLEECDEYIPQKAMEKGNAISCLSTFQRIVKQGRQRGLGSTMISQRSAVVNKDALTQADGVILLRVTAKQDREAARGWVEYHGYSKEIVDSLPTLVSGQGWVILPSTGVFHRTVFDRRRTADTGATPTFGRGEAKPVGTIADIDLGVIKDRMAETIERAKANDPRELQAEVRRLRAEIARLERDIPDVVTTTVTVEVVPEHVRDCLIDIAGGVEPIIDDLRELQSVARAALDRADKGPVEVSREGGTPVRTIERTKPSLKPVKPQVAVPPRRDTAADTSVVTKPRQRILDAIAWFASIGVIPAPKGTTAVIAGASATSGAYKNNLGALRSAGLIDYPRPNTLALTGAGSDIAVAHSEITTTDQLIAELERKLGGPKGRILAALKNLYPHPVIRDELAELVRAEPTSGAYKNNLGALRSLGFIEYPSPGMVVATEMLFID